MQTEPLEALKAEYIKAYSEEVRRLGEKLPLNLYIKARYIGVSARTLSNWIRAQVRQGTDPIRAIFAANDMLDVTAILWGVGPCPEELFD